MPRFFFHIFDDEIVRDEEGVELADEAAARRQALTGARELMCDELRQGRLTLSHHIDVDDQEGRRLFTLGFGEAVRIEG